MTTTVIAPDTPRRRPGRPRRSEQPKPQPVPPGLEIRRSLRPTAAAEFLGVSLSTFWRFSRERHDFPKLRRLSPRCVIVDGPELAEWRDAQTEQAA